MTRKEALAQYTIDESGHISDPGKFEGEAVYVPAFWEYTMDGSAEEFIWSDGDTTFLVEVDDNDRKEWPEIAPDTVALHMGESDQGFVSGQELNAADWAGLLDSYESDTQEEEDDNDEWEDDDENPKD